jgi:cell division protein FtsL
LVLEKTLKGIFLIMVILVSLYILSKLQVASYDVVSKIESITAP